MVWRLNEKEILEVGLRYEEEIRWEDYKEIICKRKFEGEMVIVWSECGYGVRWLK
jgi:hypothetical protein